MKWLLASPLSALLAAPAFAHTGVHIHPHGTESLLSILIAAAVLAGAVAYLRQR